MNRPFKSINIEIIPHENQRYETPGDYWIDDDKIMQIRVSDMGDFKKESLVYIHEIVEYILVLSRGISEKEIMDFDIEFEKNREEGNNNEPGDEVDAPYQNEHNYATSVERMMCAALGIKWNEYDKEQIDLC